MALEIRQARVEDAQRITDFTRGLAAFEGSLGEVVATPEDLARTLFSDPRPAYCELADWDGEPAGFAIWSYNFSIYLGKRCLWLEDLFVAKEFRRKGIGTALLSHLARKCRQEALGRMEWSVLKQNSPAVSFYRELGATIDEGRSKCRWTAEFIASVNENSNFSSEPPKPDNQGKSDDISDSGGSREGGWTSPDTAGDQELQIEPLRPCSARFGSRST